MKGTNLSQLVLLINYRRVYRHFYLKSDLLIEIDISSIEKRTLHPFLCVEYLIDI